MRKSALIYLLTVLSFTSTFAQDDLGDLLKGSVTDASLLLEGYIAPAMKTIGSGLNQGWYNTAKPHATLGIDLTISTSLMYITNSDKFYLVDNARLQEIKLVAYDGNQNIDINTGSANVPTIFGPDKTPTYRVLETEAEVTGPGGIDLKDALKIADAMPVPMYQLGVGLPKGFDVKLRFAPTVTLGDFKFNLLGVGLLHDIGQHLPVVKALPVDLALFAGYTRMTAEQGLSGTTVGQNQRGELVFNSTTIQALVSKKISVLTFYGGVGYNMATSSIAMKGTYDLDGDDQAESTDPVNLNFSTSGFRATGGLRLKLAVFTLHADYTLADYNALSAGFGINVR